MRRASYSTELSAIDNDGSSLSYWLIDIVRSTNYVEIIIYEWRHHLMFQILLVFYEKNFHTFLGPKYLVWMLNLENFSNCLHTAFLVFKMKRWNIIRKIILKVFVLITVNKRSILILFFFKLDWIIIYSHSTVSRVIWNSSATYRKGQVTPVLKRFRSRINTNPSRYLHMLYFTQY